MGSTNSRFFPPGEGPQSGILSKPNSADDSLIGGRSLLRTLSKAKDRIQRPKTPSLSMIGLKSKKRSSVHDRAPAEHMEGGRGPLRQNMEIIEILDDVEYDEAISLSSQSEAPRSPASSSVQYISSSASPQQAEIIEDDEYNTPDQLVDEGDVWIYEPPGGDADPVPARSRPDQREPDWGEFLIDDDIFVPQGRGPGQPSMLGSDRKNPNEPANPIHEPSFFEALINPKVECVDDVLTVFPNICRDYVTELYDSGVGEIAEQLIAHILDKLDGGTEYPRAKDKIKSLKRKREVDEDEEAANKYGNIDRENGSHDYATLTRAILSGEFTQTPMTYIDTTLNETRHHLYPAYTILEEAERTFDPSRKPYNKIKKPRSTAPNWSSDKVEATLGREDTTADTMLVLRELQAARRARNKANVKRKAEQQAQLDEEENIRQAEAEGTMLECGCCFGDFPLNRMVHCENECAQHWFCRGCAKQTAETEIGNSKYKIKCMSMDGCDYGFSRAMKAYFLDEKTSIALDRNEQEAMLRMAGIENLASCPFCPYAAEYPPVEGERLFHCQSPDCERVSCRLCKLESHIPKTCAESARDNGLCVRRQIEEAMSAALIRRCNKCGTPFVKEEGCNKMTCTRSGCYNVQCYVCSKSCTYDHFNDRARGGKPGNCPLFESVEERHREEVSKAEKEALAKVRAEHPEYSEEDLKVKVSENVKKDDERRRANDPRIHLPLGIAAPRMPPAAGLPQIARVRGAGRAVRPPGRLVEARPPPAPEVRVWQGIPEPPELHFEPGGLKHPQIPLPDAGPRQEFLPLPDFDFGPRENVPWPAAEFGQRMNMPEPPLWLYRQDNVVQYEGGGDVDAMLGLGFYEQKNVENIRDFLAPPPFPQLLGPVAVEDPAHEHLHNVAGVAIASQRRLQLLQQQQLRLNEDVEARARFQQLRRPPPPPPQADLMALRLSSRR